MKCRCKSGRPQTRSEGKIDKNGVKRVTGSSSRVPLSGYGDAGVIYRDNPKERNVNFSVVAFGVLEDEWERK